MSLKQATNDANTIKADNIQTNSTQINSVQLNSVQPATPQADFDKIIDRQNTSCIKYDFAAERGYPEGIQSFWVADMDFQAPAQVIDELVRRSAHGIFGYTAPKQDYYDSLASWFQRHHGWQVSGEEVVITPGVVFALSAAIRAFTRPGDGVIIQQPVYYPFAEVIRENDRQLVNNPLIYRDGSYQIDFEDFERKAAEENVKLFILCSPHNPVGRVWHREELLRLAEICLAKDVLIVADEIHHEFVRPGFRHTVLASLSEEIAQHTITCTAPSKTFNLAGLQVSNIFIKNTSLRRRFRQAVNAVGYSQPNTLGMFACQAAYTYGEPWLNQLRSYLEANYQRTREFLQRELPKVKLIEPEGTYLIWLDFRAYGLTDTRLDDIIIHKANLWLDSGHIFGEGGSGFQRINIACPWATLEKGLKSLAAAFQAIS